MANRYSPPRKRLSTAKKTIPRGYQKGKAAKKIKSVGTAALTALLLGGVQPIYAEIITHWYFGVNFLQTEYEIDGINELNQFSDGSSTEYITATENTDDNGWKIFAGYQFSRYLAVEAGYVNLGKYKQSGVFNTYDIPVTILIEDEDPIEETIDVPGTIETSLLPKGIEVAGVALSPNWYGLSLRAKAGLLISSYEARFKLARTFPANILAEEAQVDVRRFEDQSTEIEFVAGVGLDYRFNSDWSLGFHWDRYFDVGSDDTGEADLDIVGVDLSYHY